MIKNRRAAAKGEFRQSDDHARAGSLRSGASPDAVLSLQPGEKVVILTIRKITGECLVEMVVTIHKTGQHDLTFHIDDRICRLRKICRSADLLDDTILHVNTGIFDFPAILVHCDNDFGVFGEQCFHDSVRVLGWKAL